MRRFFHPTVISGGSDAIVLAGQEARHIASVLRMKPGDPVELFDGQGGVWTAILQTVSPSRVTAILSSNQCILETEPFPLTLAQAVLKGKKMDLVIQKATELGVHSFLPVETAYCNVHGSADIRADRWQRIMIEACKQCRRNQPMTLLPTTPIGRCDFSAFTHRLAAWESESRNCLPSTIVETPGPVCLFIGPEGGLHTEDLEQLRQWQFATFSLGRRILRGETATLAAVAIVRYLTGDLGPQHASR